MIDYRKLIIFIVCEISLSVANVNDPTLVTLPEGRIKGKTLHSPDDKVYYAFQEIPYAAPPVGKLRFQPPTDPPKWNRVLNTTKNTKTCCKTDTVSIPNTIETEDCLYLNVFTPAIPGDTSKPPLGVLIWIHAGGFAFGSGVAQMYKPQYFMDHNIIIVTMNYRLGALGFLTTEDEVIPGNLGLKDQQMAIKWVKKNIHLFGGDPDKITITGSSAGATSVGFQLISPKNRGLFRGAILQSGTPLNQWTRQDYARFYAFELGRSLDPNFKSDDSKELLKLLQRTPVSKIINNTVSPSIGKESGLIEGTGYIWLPVIEHANLEEALLTSPFHEDIRKGNINKVSTLIGFNSEEELLFWKPVTDTTQLLEARAKYFDNDLSKFIRNKFNMTKENKLIAGRKIRKIYTNRTFENDLPKLIKRCCEEQKRGEPATHSQLNWSNIFNSLKPIPDFCGKELMLDWRPGIEIAGHRPAVTVIAGDGTCLCWSIMRHYIKQHRQLHEQALSVLFFSDDSFTTAITRHAKLQSNYTDVYLYQFSYKGKMGGLKDFEVAGVRGVGHGEELGYLFDLPASSDGTPDDPEDLVTRQRLLTLWANFVKCLNPTPERDSLLNNVIWEKVTPSSLVYLNINTTLEMQRNPRQYLKWEKIIDAYAIPPLVNY